MLIIMMTNDGDYKMIMLMFSFLTLQDQQKMFSLSEKLLTISIMFFVPIHHCQRLPDHE